MTVEEILEKEMTNLQKGIPIQLGVVRMNKSYRYLYPIVRFYGQEVYERIRTTHKLGVGINDVVFWKENHIVLTNELFILVDTKGEYRYDTHVNPITSQMKFADDLAFLKSKGILSTDYVFDDISGHLHMLVLKVPEDVPHAVRAFVLGRYELIFTDKQASRLFHKDSVEYKVVTNDKAYRVILSEAIMNKLETIISPEDLPGLTGKPNFEQEIFKQRLYEK